MFCYQLLLPRTAQIETSSDVPNKQPGRNSNVFATKWYPFAIKISSQVATQTIVDWPPDGILVPQTSR